MNDTISEILKNLYDIDTPDGFSEEEFAFLENKFGKLPTILREFYSLGGHCDNVLMNQDRWIVPEDYNKWKELGENPYMVLLEENQNVCFAAILENDLGKEDPPVYVSDDSGENWKSCTDSLEKFIKATLVYEAVFAVQYSSEAFYTVTRTEFELLKEKLILLPFHMENWFGTVWLFQDLPDSAVFVMEACGDFEMLYGAASERSFNILAEKLDGIGEEM